MANNNLGLGVMIQMLSGAGADFDPSPFFGKPIESIEVAGDVLHIRAAGGHMTLRDTGQSCCEHRYMHTDDDLPYYVGSRLLGLELRDGPEGSSEYGDPKECQFLLIKTDKGDITVANYNEHNGYYGGFCIVGNVIEDPSDK